MNSPVSIDLQKRESIYAFIGAIEHQYNVEVILAVESGSRAWGFPSQDSDYDIRLIYHHAKDWYVSPFAKSDVIENAFKGDLDLAGWDVAKALALMHKGNAPLCEWLHSPVVYRDNAIKSENLKRLSVRSFNPKPMFYHYTSLAKKKLLGKAVQHNAKSFLYALRALLCARWIADRHSMPPVNFFELTAYYLSEKMYAEPLRALLDDKACRREEDDYVVPSVLCAFAQSELERLLGIDVPVLSSAPIQEDFEQVLHGILK
jgi:predicted nucleotidyltransferase